MKILNVLGFALIISLGTFGQSNTFPSTGSVGIGTTTPADQLEVVNGNRKIGFNTPVSGAYPGGILSLSRPDDGTKVMFLGGASSPTDDNVVFGMGGSSELRLVSAGGSSAGFGFYTNVSQAQAFGNVRPIPVAKIDGSGNVGLGTSSPAATLHINSTAGRTAFRTYLNGNTTNYLSLWQGTGGAVIDPIGSGLLFLGYDLPTNVIVGYNGGNLGIGTQTPGAFLDVNSNNNISQALQDWSITGVHILSAGYTLGGANPVYLTTENPSRPLTLQSNGGNVGIGTNAPDAKLSVSGQVHAQEVKVSITVPSPDYVFDKDYKLLSLEDIKNYIDQNKHLPEVPSAKEMEKNGVQLGEMNMLLLKKIEELTLYVIELKKEMQELKENQQIKK